MGPAGDLRDHRHGWPLPHGRLCPAAACPAKGCQSGGAGSCQGGKLLQPQFLDDCDTCLDPLSAGHRRANRCSGLSEMGGQFRHPDPDLCDARLGPEHRRRPRRPAGPRLRRFLRSRCLFLRAALHLSGPVLLGVVAGGRPPRRLLGRGPRLPGASSARRLSGDRHACLRRNHPSCPDQLDRGHQRYVRRVRHCQGNAVRHQVRCLQGWLCRIDGAADLVGLLQDLPILPDPRSLLDHGFRDDPHASDADRARLGSAARR
ncbi:hypothetical protein D9M72_476190 [compost metagenome]